MAAAGILMLAMVAVVLLVTGLPSWLVLIGVAMLFGAIATGSGMVPGSLLTALPARLVGLLENDLLQALPLYVLLGALLNHLPLAGILFRTGRRTLASTGAGASLAGLGLAVLLAPMNGSVGASALMLARTVQPRLDASGVPRARGAALVCVASTLGVVVPPSLVLILLGDAMMRAHTEATNVTHIAVRIMNTQDVFLGVLGPAALLLALTAIVAWWQGRHRAREIDIAEDASPRGIEWVLASGVAAVIVALFAGVLLGYLFAVEAAATGGIALFAFGVVTRTLTIAVLRDVLRDTMAVTGALFALLIAATMFTLVFRVLGTDRWLTDILATLPGGAGVALMVVMAIVAACALVLDAFEMIFVVVPIVMPPLLMVVQEATWVAVLTLLILQTSFLMPPFGYAVLLSCQLQREPQPLRTLMAALAPYLAVQWLVVALVVTLPHLVWQPGTIPPQAAPGVTMDPDAGRDALIEQLRRQEPDEPAPAVR